MNKSVLSTLAFAGLATFGLTATASADSTYTIEKGDTLTSIANKFNTTVSHLALHNNIKDIHTIYAGETVTIKDAAGVVAPVAQAPVAPQTATIAKPVQAPVAQAEVAVAPAAVAAKPAQQVAPKPVAQAVPTPQSAPAQVAKQVQAPAAPVVQTQAPVAKPAPAPAQPTGSGSVYDQFIAAGGTAGMWQHIVMPESTGNPNAISPNGYRGLGQTKEAWGTGSVAQQTKGMINYMNSRYGSEANALAFRAANGWW